MHALTRLLLAGLCAAAAASAVQAQGRLNHVPNRTPPPSAQSSQAAPQPGGLRPVFPAGISSGSGAAVSSDPIAATTSPIPAGTVAPLLPGPGDTPLPELPSGASVMGAGATVRGPAQTTASGAGGFRAAEIADYFILADINKDGELTRAEASRLNLGAISFEEMDRNFDGVITRFEFQDAVR